MSATSTLTNTVVSTLVPIIYNTTLAPQNATTAAPAELATMNWQAWVTVFTCASVLVSLSLGIVDCAPAMVVSAVFLYLCQIVALTDVLSGLSNSSVATIALLFIIVDPIADLPKVRAGVGKVLGDLSNSVGLRWATFKIVVLCMGTSSFLNNTPQVAVLTNIVKLYCRDCGAYPSQILLPMNFATLCGNYALIGTSTNLIVDGLMQNWGFSSVEKCNVSKRR
jgi:Na+/H+ antiporter NhaD/arsenite permease-like protein